MPTTTHTSLIDTELISEEISDIISDRPHWSIRHGNILLFSIIMLLLIFSWFIQYPDIVNGRARLLAINAPKMVAAKTDGKIEKILVNIEQDVQAGMHLAYLQSNGRHDQVLLLQSWLQKTFPVTQNGNFQTLLSDPLPLCNQLGELQPSYQDFSMVINEIKQIINSGYYIRKKDALQKDLAYLDTMKKNITQQKELLEQDNQLQKKEYEVYKTLEKEKIIAPLDLDESRKKLIAKQYNVKQVDVQLINSALSSHDKKKELLELDKSVLDLEQKFNSQLVNLQNDIQKWINQYIVIAPENGKVFYINMLQENQLIATGQELFFIQSPKSSYYGEVMVSQNGFGKVKVGQRIVLKISGYPSSEYGSLTGKVAYIAHLPNRNDSFSVKIDLPNGLRTNYQKDLFFRNNLLAQAEIITDNRRFLSRIFQKFKVWDR
jgi:HlyD family secretion protein